MLLEANKQLTSTRGEGEMRKNFSLFAASLLLVAMTIVTAQAKTETATFQISDPVTVAGVVLEKGNYTFKFDDNNKPTDDS